MHDYYEPPAIQTEIHRKQSNKMTEYACTNMHDIGWHARVTKHESVP